MEREGAPIGALITLEEPSAPMLTEAVSAGFYSSPGLPDVKYPKVQILTIEELLSGKRLLYPASVQVTFKKAERKAKEKPDAQPSLFWPCFGCCHWFQRSPIGNGRAQW